MDVKHLTNKEITHQSVGKKGLWVQVKATDVNAEKVYSFDADLTSLILQDFFRFMSDNKLKTAKAEAYLEYKDTDDFRHTFLNKFQAETPYITDALVRIRKNPRSIRNNTQIQILKYIPK